MPSDHTTQLAPLGLLNVEVPSDDTTQLATLGLLLFTGTNFSGF